MIDSLSHIMQLILHSAREREPRLLLQKEIVYAVRDLIRNIQLVT